MYVYKKHSKKTLNQNNFFRFFIYVISFSDANQNFRQPLRQSSVSHNPSEIISNMIYYQCCAF